MNRRDFLKAAAAIPAAAVLPPVAAAPKVIDLADIVLIPSGQSFNIEWDHCVVWRLE